MMTARVFVGLLASSLAVGVLAAPPPLRPHGPHGRVLPPNAEWCRKCDGDGYNRTWYGWAKKCHVCDGRGWIVHRRPVPPPPKPNHAAPAPKGPQHHPGPAPAAGRPGPQGGRPGPQGGRPGPQGGRPGPR